MEHIGLDLGMHQSQIAILTDAGELIDKRIRTERSRLQEFFGSRPRAKILIEAATESEWVARVLEDVGHDVIVADPNYAPMYAHRTRRIKTDRRDAHALARACRAETYRLAHRLRDCRQSLRPLLAVREALVRTRTRWIGLVRPLLRQQGLRVRSGQAETFARRVQELVVPAPLQGMLTPLLALLTPLNETIAALDAQVSQLVGHDPVTARLMTVPGVGPVTALCFVATVDQVERFREAHQLESYLGLVPREWSSSERQRKGAITKAGNTRMRWLLVEAARCLLHRSKTPATAPLRDWAEAIARRRGHGVATVALARRLAGILFALWRDDTVYDPKKLRRGIQPLHAA